MRELIVDSFAGGGGASTGLAIALGRSPDFAINHDPEALAMHAANHPETVHLPHNVWKVDPLEVCKGQPVGLLWASPDCKHFSKAKGGKPVKKNIRDLAWVVVRWARQVSPRVIMLENVEEFQKWGPLTADNMPCPERAGQTFQKFVRELGRLGYKVEWRELVAADYGSPTTRKRLFLIARRDGLPIIWPKSTHGRPDSLPVKAGKAKPWRTAAECIDWTLPCYSIFLTKADAKRILKRNGVRLQRPLAKNTMARIARGVKRYVLDAERPFIVPITHTGDQRVCGLDEPHRTTTCAQRGEHALVAPFIAKQRRGATGASMETPMPTVTANSFEKRPGGAVPLSVIAPLIVKNYHGDRPDSAATDPLKTILTGQHHMAVAPVLVGVGSRAGQSPERSVDRPGPTTTATKRGQHALVAAGLVNTRNGERQGQEPRVRDPGEPMLTTTAGGSQGAIAVAHLVRDFGGSTGAAADGPSPTVMPGGGGKIGVVTAHLCAHYGPGEGGQNRAASAEEPLRTTTCEPRHSVVTAYLAQHNTDMVGHSVDQEPLSTIVQKGCTQAVVAANLISLKGSDRRDGSAEDPAPAQCAGGTHTGVVTAFMQRYFGKLQDPRLEEPIGCQTTKDRSGLIEVREGIPPLTAAEYARAKQVAKFMRKYGCWDGGELVTTKDGSVVVDIGMRMLIPRELFRAQGFSDAYIIAYGITDKGEQIPLTKTAQIRLVGNSVCPDVAAALVAANYQPMAVNKRGVPEFALTAAE